MERKIARISIANRSTYGGIIGAPTVGIRSHGAVECIEIAVSDIGPPDKERDRVILWQLGFPVRRANAAVIGGDDDRGVPIQDWVGFDKVQHTAQIPIHVYQRAIPLGSTPADLMAHGVQVGIVDERVI